MYYHLKESIYAAQFRDELILLDTKKDKYIICEKQLLDLFNIGCEKDHLDKKRLSRFCNSTLEFPNQEHIQELLAHDIIQAKESPYPFHIDRKPISAGVSNIDWRLPLEDKKVRWDAQVLEALITLFKINFYMKFKGFYSMILLIKQSRNLYAHYVIPQEQELKGLANKVNKACLIYPTRTKCLEWAMTFILLALRRKWKCNLEIGVQNYPFMAHAWVECEGKVVMDSQDLREGLAIVLNEPFRKVRK